MLLRCGLNWTACDFYCGTRKFFLEGKHEDAEDEKSIPPIDTRQEQWKTMLLSNKYKRMPAMIIYTSGTTGRPKVRIFHMTLHFTTFPLRSLHYAAVSLSGCSSGNQFLTFWILSLGLQPIWGQQVTILTIFTDAVEPALDSHPIRRHLLCRVKKSASFSFGVIYHSF